MKNIIEKLLKEGNKEEACQIFDIVANLKLFSGFVHHYYVKRCNNRDIYQFSLIGDCIFKGKSPGIYFKKYFYVLTILGKKLKMYIHELSNSASYSVSNRIYLECLIYLDDCEYEEEEYNLIDNRFEILDL